MHSSGAASAKRRHSIAGLKRKASAAIRASFSWRMRKASSEATEAGTEFMNENEIPLKFSHAAAVLRRQIALDRIFLSMKPQLATVD